jgi:hypothetical protein
MATITIPALKVIEAANAAIQNLQDDIDRLEAKKEKEIADILARNKVFCLTKTFPWIGRRAAKKNEIHWGRLLDSYVNFYIRAKETRMRAVQKLLLVAQHGDPVTLNENDVSILFGEYVVGFD